MSHSNLIRLNYALLRNYISNEYPRFLRNVFMATDFVVLHSFEDVLKDHLAMGQPYYLKELRLAHITKGTGNITINLIEHKCSAGKILYIRGGSIVQTDALSSDFELEGISVNDDLLQLLFKGRVPSCFLSGKSSNILEMSPAEDNILHRIMQTLWITVHHETLGLNIVYSLLTSILFFYDNMNGRNLSETHSTSSREQNLFLQFIDLVNQYSKKERKLSFYASKICLSQHYLGTIIRQVSGSTAKEWIEKSVITEAKVMLKHTDMLSYQISDELNFPNSSFFCKFFKRLTGMTPQEYQRS